jgi:Mg2+/Co2+ transporter CorB
MTTELHFAMRNDYFNWIPGSSPEDDKRVDMTLILFGCLVALIFISAFFSGAETGMMATNRYKLRAKVKAGNRGATRTQNLLQRPDRLLGMILIGNTFANIAASALATVLASRLWGDAGVVITTIVLTLVILLFSEVLPKTFAAFKPESYAFAASGPLSTLLTLFFPLIWLVNTLAAWLLKPFGIKVQHKGADPLSIEELRHAVHASSSTLAQKHQAMLLGVMDLE